MRATGIGRRGSLGQATAWALGTLSVLAAATTTWLVWEVLVDPLSVARAIELLVGRP